MTMLCCIIESLNEGFLPSVESGGLPLRREGNSIIFPVLDSEGNPLAGATVSVRDSISVITNGAGEAIFPKSLFKGKTEVQLTVSHPDFEPVTFIQPL